MRQNYYALGNIQTGPFKKAERPLLATRIQASIVSPAGQDIVTGQDEETWMLFNMWTPGVYRAMGLARLERDVDALVIPDLTREPMPAPEASP
jgi:hypothetical protein